MKNSFSNENEQYIFSIGNSSVNFFFEESFDREIDFYDFL